MKSILDTAAMYGRNRYGRRFDDLDLKSQVQVLTDELGQSHLKRDKRAGYRTAKARAYVVHAVVADLRDAGYMIKNIRNLDQRHITIVASRWVEAGLAASTLQTRFSILRWLAVAVGKAGLVRDPSFYSIPDASMKRTYAATKDRSWSGHGIDRHSVIQEAGKQDEWVGIQLDLMDNFGLRMAEAIMLRPSQAQTGNVLRVEAGTKGGRTRLVRISNPKQEEVLLRAQEMAKRTARGNLVPPGKTLQQAKDRLYYIVRRKLGICKAGLGVTPHGLRHGFALDLYEEEAGGPALLRGGGILERARDIAAREAVTNALGHSRISVTAAYTGPRAKGRPPKGRPATLETKLPQANQGVQP